MVSVEDFRYFALELHPKLTRTIVPLNAVGISTGVALASSKSQAPPLFVVGGMTRERGGDDVEEVRQKVDQTLDGMKWYSLYGMLVAWVE